jgi:hypothetical protein
MANKIKITNENINNCFKKGNVYISNDYKDVTHNSGFFNGLSSDNKYTFYIDKTGGIVEDGLILALDAGNQTSYRTDLLLNNFLDISGNETDMTLYNGVGYDSGLTFDGTNQYGKIDEHFTDGITGFTMISWFKKDGEGSTYECVLHKNYEGTYTIGNADFWMGFQISSDNLCATIGSNGDWSKGLTTTSAEIGVWYNLAATWDGSTVNVYINGEYELDYSLTTFNNTNTPTRIGAGDDGTNYQFNGTIGNVFLYNRGLSSDEILQIYNATKERYI